MVVGVLNDKLSSLQAQSINGFLRKQCVSRYLCNGHIIIVLPSLQQQSRSKSLLEVAENILFRDPPWDLFIRAVHLKAEVINFPTPLCTLHLLWQPRPAPLVCHLRATPWSCLMSKSGTTLLTLSHVYCDALGSLQCMFGPESSHVPHTLQADGSRIAIVANMPGVFSVSQCGAKWSSGLWSSSL